MIAAQPNDILTLAAEAARDGIRGTIVTLTGIQGSSSRAIGTQMVVLADGRLLGSFSGGCIEHAVVQEAQEVARCGAPRTVRFGSGSPYIDLRLPCGGAIDLLFTPLPSFLALDAARTALALRHPVKLMLGDWQQVYAPPLRLIAFGHGEDLVALSRTARALGIAAECHAPETDLHRDHTISAFRLRTQLPPVSGDAWTAIVFAFHDRDWEEFLLPQALTLEAFYYGAVGSLRTHQARIAALRAKGVPALRIDALRGAIGLIPSTRDPAALALSIIAEIVHEYQITAYVRSPEFAFPRSAPARL